MSDSRTKRMLSLSLRFIKANVIPLWICSILYVFYRTVIGPHATWILIATLLVYSNAMAANFYGRRELARLKKAGKCSMKALIALSAMTFSPIYLCWILFAVLPIPSYTVWLILEIPLVVISGVLLYGMAYQWEPAPRRLWWGLQLPIYLITLFVGQLTGRLIFP